MIYSAGNKGEFVRSDCYIKISPNPGNGNSIQLVSKVEKLFGDSIKELIIDILKFFKVDNVKIEIEDSGALPFVIAARMEAAIHQFIKTEKEYLLSVIDQNLYRVNRDQNRRTRLYLPGNNPKLMINSGIYGGDAIILDLEDSVSPERKSEARILVRNALCQIDFYGAERMVRINQIPNGIQDLQYIVPYNVNTILIPKCEDVTQIRKVDIEIEKLAGTKDHGIFLMPIIESALGVENAFRIATASSNIVALAIGLEDYTADLGVQRTMQGTESLYARTRIVNASIAAGIQPIDSVFSEFEDMELLKENVRRSKVLGFVGMGCIHPRQIKVINEVFSPNEMEIEKAKKIVLAFYKAEKEGKAVVAVGSKMVDPPVVKRALKVIDEAVKAKMLDKNWRAVYEG
ncbi:MAG: citrate lyase subunit gamma [Mariniphaga sp.]|nr:citrate lyase subunit gamma [Mariniphaga sp.]